MTRDLRPPPKDATNATYASFCYATYIQKKSARNLHPNNKVHATYAKKTKKNAAHLSLF